MFEDSLNKFERRTLSVALGEVTDRLTILSHVYEYRLQQQTIHKNDYVHLEGIRNEVELVLRELSREVAEHGNFESLLRHTESRRSALQADDLVIQREIDSRDKIKRVQSELNTLQADVHKESTALDDSIVILKMQIQEAKRNFQKDVPLLVEECRLAIDQIMSKFTETEETLRLRIESLKRSIEEENTSHDDVVYFFDQCLKAMEQMEDESEKRYKNEMASTDGRIQALGDKLKDMKAKEEELKNALDRLSKVLDDERTVLEAERQKKRDAEKLAAAIKIQIWWRKVTAEIVARNNSKKKRKKTPTKKK